MMISGLLVLAQAAARQPLSGGPPISGPIWTVVIPAILFVVTAAGTWALYRRFSDQDHD